MPVMRADIVARPVERHVHGADRRADSIRPVGRRVVDGDISPEFTGRHELALLARQCDDLFLLLWPCSHGL
jgi:hypothetical protein